MAKFFRVAKEGATTDGRTMKREWIEQCAKNYNQAKFGARVWLEHFRSILPDGLFKALGDVVALEARKEADGKLALYAQIAPTADLVKMNQDRQKMYTSIEIDPSFADTGEAYLTGLAVTDSPASLGTEMLQFSSQAASNPLASRKQKPDNLFTEALETEFDFEDDEDDQGNAGEEKFFDKIKAMLFSSAKKTKDDFSKAIDQVHQAVEAIASAHQELANKFSELEKDDQDQKFKDLETKFSDLSKEFNQLQDSLDKEPSHKQRPRSNGGDGTTKTDC